MQDVKPCGTPQQYGDSMVCENCGRRWDLDEPKPPCPIPAVDDGAMTHEQLGPGSKMNRGLRALDISLCAISPHPHLQLGVAIMLCVLAAGRVLDSHAPERGKRMKLIKTMIGEFDSKLRTYVRMQIEKGQSESTG